MDKRTSRTGWNQCTFPQEYSRNSRHLILQIYQFHHPKISLATSLMAPMPQEQCSVGSALYNPYMNGFVKSHLLELIELFDMKASSRSLKAHNQKLLLCHLHPKEDWMVLYSYRQHLLHEVLPPHEQCLPRICKDDTRCIRHLQICISILMSHRHTINMMEVLTI